MRIAAVIALAVAGVGVARIARVRANDARPGTAVDAPYAPTPAVAPIVTLGYRELAADLLYVRLLGYYPDYYSEPKASAVVAEAIVALDPQFRRVYELGAIAMTDARRPPEPALQLQAIALLERGARLFPTDFRFPMLAGQIYIADLQTTDPAQRRIWNEKGALLLESASRKPGAPRDLGLSAGLMRSKLGQHQRAIASLRELFLLTKDAQARRDILDQLATMERDAGADVAAELFQIRRQLEDSWKSARPAVPQTMYFLIGAPVRPGFDLADLAMGGVATINVDTFERLEPAADEPAAPPSGSP